VCRLLRSSRPLFLKVERTVEVRTHASANIYRIAQITGTDHEIPFDFLSVRQERVPM
jgi:hypothetical protein